MFLHGWLAEVSRHTGLTDASRFVGGGEIIRHHAVDQSVQRCRVLRAQKSTPLPASSHLWSPWGFHTIGAMAIYASSPSSVRFCPRHWSVRRGVQQSTPTPAPVLVAEANASFLPVLRDPHPVKNRFQRDVVPRQRWRSVRLYRRPAIPSAARSFSPPSIFGLAVIIIARRRRSSQRHRSWLTFRTGNQFHCDIRQPATYNLFGAVSSHRDATT